MTNQKYGKTLSAIPMLHGLPMIGNLLDLRFDRLNLLVQISRKCGDIGAFRVGPQIFLLINSSELIHKMLVEHAYDFERPANLRAWVRPVLGNGLLSSENDFHKQQRKLVMPAFHYHRLSTYADTIIKYTDQLQSEWTEGETIDISRQMMRLTLGIIGKALFDADVLEEAKELREALTITMRHVNTDFATLVHIPYVWPTLRNIRFNSAVNRLNTTVYRIISDRRKSHQDRGDLLSMLLQTRNADDGSSMTNAQVRDEVMTLFLAGHETTANALAWAWYLLTQNLEVYKKMCEEVDCVLGRRAPTFADLSNMPYTLQVFKEAIRLYPPAYMSGRQVIHPVELGGYHLPVGTMILNSSYTIHRRSDYFLEPEHFDPGRFTPEAEQLLPRYAYIPFGAGPHVCIGKQFALMEGHLILAAMAQRVTFKLLDDQRIIPDPLITLRPKYGIKMLVHPR